jgi:hypothetical protein
MTAMGDTDDRLKLLEAEIERRLVERFAALRDEFDRLRLESDRRWAGFLDRFEQKFTGIVPPELLLAPQEFAQAPAPAPAPGRVSVDDARKLDEAPNQVEILHRFLDGCLRHASRIALIVSRSGGLSVWKALGFSDHGGDDEGARRATLSRIRKRAVSCARRPGMSARVGQPDLGGARRFRRRARRSDSDGGQGKISERCMPTPLPGASAVRS